MARVLNDEVSVCVRNHCNSNCRLLSVLSFFLLLDVCDVREGGYPKCGRLLAQKLLKPYVCELANHNKGGLKGEELKHLISNSQ